MAKISFLDCPHNNVQQFSECCLDCGYNIYTSKKEYLKDLERQTLDARIRAQEDYLGIKKPVINEDNW